MRFTEVCVFAAVVLTLSLALLTSGCGGGGGDTTPPPPNPFAGTYSGAYSGDESGNWNATVDSSGKIAATADHGFTGTGTMSLAGGLNLHTTGSGSTSGITITWVGTFSIHDGGTTGSGTWSASDGEIGTWTGHRE
jgi:hypothetical protein